MNQINFKQLWTHTSQKSVVLGLTTAMLLSAATPVLAQNGKSISGMVKDENGEPIIGASVRVAGSNSTGAVTDLDGKFKLNVPAKSTLEISYVGYVTQKVKITGASEYNVDLREDAQNLNAVVVVGYGTQKKATLTGAVSAINNEELSLTKSQDAKNMLTGKVAGVRVTQNTSEPGEFGYGNFDIRGYGGSPLIVVDGVPRGNFERLDPNEIESISVLKDASAAIYGVRGGNGVILVTTKKGNTGKAKIEYSMYYGIQTPADVLQPVGAVDRMTLFNEKTMRSQTDPRLTYDDAAFQQYYDGTKASTDWYKAVMAKTAPQQQHNLSISGGNDKMDYFVNFGYMDQKGFFQSDDLDYNRYNFRSNLNAKITKNLKLGVRLSATIDKRDRPYYSPWEIFGTLWRCNPEASLYANDTAPFYYHFGNNDNPVAMMSKDVVGYKINNNKILASTFDATYDIPYVKGLSLKGLFSYDNTIQDNTSWRKEYADYEYDATTQSYKAYKKQGPSNINRYYGNSWSTLWQASLNYDHTFAEDHHVTGLLLYEESYSKGDNFSGARNSSLQLPYLYAGDKDDDMTADGGKISELARKSLVGRFNYDYKGRYMAEFSFRYDGSSKFADGHRWGFFPSVSAGWRISEESFIKNNLKFIDNLKLRASWGSMGDDGAADFQWLTGYDYPFGGGLYNNYSSGYIFGGKVVNALGFHSLPNTNISWYKIKTTNIGLDADLWKGLLGITIEVFRRDRSGLLAYRVGQVPGSLGAGMPQENLNSDMTQGLEIELRHRNAIGDFHYEVKGNMSLTRSKYKHYERTPLGNSYANWQARDNNNRYNDIWFGYGGSGRYGSFDQIANSGSYGMGNGANATLPGDYQYEDWNHDGVIDDMDKHPIATTLSSGDFSAFQNKRNYPLMNFGITLSGDWKGLDLSLAFQGSAMSYVAYGEQLSAPLAWEGNALDFFLDRWHPADPKQDPYDPSAQWISGYYAYGAKSPDTNSTFAIQKGDYLRLKSAEIGYTIPRQWLSFLGVQNLRVFVNAYNLFTITGVKGLDPERPAQLYGQMYPLNRSYNFGASVTF